MRLVLIHGRDQQGKDPKTLSGLWMETWEKGLKENGLSVPGELEVVFPYYGDLLDGLVQQAALPQSVEGIIARGDLPAADLEFFQDFLMELVDNSGIPHSEIVAGFEGLPQERGPLNWRWVQAILKVLDRTGLGDMSLHKFTYDAFLYLTLPAIREKIDTFVTGEMGPGNAVVVGHSLGSVVAYNVLKDNPQFNVQRYITVGSPLGLNSFKTKLDTPLVMPHCIKHGWYNAYDDADVVALQPLADHFKIDPVIEDYKKVKNTTDNRHGIEGYLNDSSVALKIYESLHL